MENSSNLKEHLKKRYLIFLLSLGALCIPFHFYGQATTVNPLNTDFGTPPEFLGWDNTVNSFLHIRHNEPGQPIMFKIACNE